MTDTAQGPKIGVSLGAGVVVARYFGAKDWQRMRRTIHTTVALGLAAGAVLTVVGVLLTPQILRWMGTPDNVLVNSIAYFRMYFMGSIAVVMYNVGASILQSVGDSRSPMRYLIAASIINIVLDLVLIGGLRMGVGAAAFATVASQTVSAVLAFSKLIRSKEEWAVRPREVRFDGPSLKAVIVQGLPSGIQNSVISLANVIVQSNINSFGANAMAGCGAYSKVEGFAFLPVTCFAMALATFVSQNVGAGQPDRVRKGMKFGILCSIAMAEVVGVCIYLASPWLIGAFSSEPDVIAFGVQQAHTAARPTSKLFTAWAINGREARQNEVAKPLGKAAVWPGSNGACPFHVRDHHSPVSCDKTDGGAADGRGAAAVRPCGDFCTDAGVWKAAVAVYR